MDVKPPDGRGEIARLAAIARVAAQKGWGHYAERLGFGAALPGGTPAPRTSDAVRLREAFEELGPTFVKLGQMMAGRGDLFPEQLVAELGRLQEHARAFPAEVARRIVERETGRSIAELYAGFDDAPTAAASMAQVHRATLHDGAAVIVKVQRPDIAATIEADIAVLRRLAGLLGSAVPAVRAFNLPGLVEELAQTLRGELDFEREARNAERFAQVNEDEPAVYVPRIYWQATTRRVLTMEYCPGRRLDSLAGEGGNPQLAQLVTRLFLQHVFEHGVFHGDPHRGNLVLLADGRVCFHDFGALGELSPHLQEKLREVFLAVVARDASWAASAYIGMGGARGEIERGPFAHDLGAALDRYYRESEMGGRSFTAILQEFVRLGRRHQILIPREVALLLRAFGELEALSRSIDPKYEPLAAFRLYSGRLLKHALVPEMGVGRIAHLYRFGAAARDVVGDGPVALQRLIGRLERGEPLFDIRHQSGGSLERHLLHASNRLAFALIIAAIVVGSAIVVAADAGPHIGDMPVLGVLGFAVSGVLGAAWGVLALTSGKL
jgi:ubiquinone biosynthesis protein